MSQNDGQRHQLRCFQSRESEHNALIPGALFVPSIRILVNSQCDVGRLLRDNLKDLHRFGVEGRVTVRVSDIPDCLASDGFVIDFGGRGNLASDDHGVLLAEHFARDTRMRVLGKIGVEN
jgi:hypothetical protein